MGKETVLIKFTAKDLTGGALKGLNKGLGGISKRMGKLRGAIFSLKGAFLGLGVGLLAKSFVEAASTSEQLQTRLTVLLGSVSEGSRLFNEMSDFASKVPFEFEAIMESATVLAGVMKGGVDEIKQWMPLIGDLAATTGLTIGETTEQIQRMLSAGAASADKFRERGVLAMLGFQAGVSVSVEQTRKMLVEAWKSPTSKFRGATALLASTWGGLMSMMSDKWFQFRNMIMDAGIMDFMKAIAIVVNDKLGVSLENLKDSAQDWADKLIDSTLSLAIGGASILDALRRPMSVLRAIANDMWNGFQSLPSWVQQIGIVGAMLGGAKGAASLALLTKFASDFEVNVAWWKTFSADQISFGEWIITGHEGAKRKMAQIQQQLMETAELFRSQFDIPDDGNGEGVLVKSVFGKDGPGPAKLAVIDFANRVKGLMAEMKVAREEALGDGDGAGGTQIELIMEDIALRYGILDASLLNEQERQQLHNAKQLFGLEQQLKNKTISNKNYLIEKEKIETEHANKMTKFLRKSLEGSFGFGQAIRKREFISALSHGVNMLSQARGASGAMFQLWKGAALAQSLVNLPAAVIASYKNAGGYPWGIIPAGLMLAAGLSEINKIRGTSQAHAGLTNVPRDETFLLRQGERVVAPEQNRDLTSFLSGRGGGGTTISDLTFNINIYGAELLEMDESELQELLASRFIPALDSLSDQGIRQQDFSRGEQL